ncbi:MAG: SpoIIE family protein phosphatase [Verrucomicrobiota bacterium]
MSEARYQEIGYCEIDADFENVAAAAAKLKAYCQLRSLEETLWHQLELIFCEALNNAIEHGCKEEASLQVHATWKWEDEFIEITIDDPGSIDEPDAQSELPEDILSESGRGLFIIESLVDEMMHENLPSGHRLIIRKELHRPQNPVTQMQESDRMIRTMSASLQKSYTKNSVLQGLSEDLAANPLFEGILLKGLERFRLIAPISDVQVWIRNEDKLVRTILPDEIPHEITLPLSSANTIAQSFNKKETLYIPLCSELPMEDPIYSEETCGLACPILFQGDPIGVIAFIAPKSEALTIDGPVKDLAAAFAQFLGIAYTSALTYKTREEIDKTNTELEIASEIQQSLLPSQYPENEYCKTSGKCVTALAVGGDYIDAIEIRDVGLLIVIADVMGKGVPAALLATIFRTAIRSRLNLAETPGWLLSQINKQIHDDLGHLNMFITAQAAFLTYDKKKLKLASAGHCPALLLSSGENRAKEFTAEGMPLGIDANDIFEERLIDLDTNDRVIFITDGLYEAENEKGGMLGIEGFKSQLSKLADESVDTLPGRVFDFINRYSGEQSAQDDKTLLALEIL